MNKISVVSFRVAVAAATKATAPVTVKLNPTCAAMVQLEIWCTTVPALITSGWRALTRDCMIIPDNGSNEEGITLGIHEAGWAPLPNPRAVISLCDHILTGPPFELTLQFYTTAAIEVGGILTVRDPRYDVHDLVVNLAALQKEMQYARRDNSTS